MILWMLRASCALLAVLICDARCVDAKHEAHNATDATCKARREKFSQYLADQRYDKLFDSTKRFIEECFDDPEAFVGFPNFRVGAATLHNWDTAALWSDVY